MPLYDLKKSLTSKMFHDNNKGFYVPSENALPERFIASDGMGSELKMLQLIASPEIMHSIQVRIQFNKTLCTYLV